eukprot:EG_transcript_20120
MGGRRPHHAWCLLALLLLALLRPAPARPLNCSEPPQRNGLAKKVRWRMKCMDPRRYAHFADRLWLNRWPKAQQCGAAVPEVLAFYSPANVSLLGQFEAPAEGAIVKVNHWAGRVTVLRPGARVSPHRLERYRNISNASWVVEKERHYDLARRGILVERLLSPETLPDYKFYCFNGHSPFLRVLLNRWGSHEYFFVDPNTWQRFPHVHRFNAQEHRGPLPKPCGLEGALRAVRCLSRGIGFARIDMYLVDCRPYLGEVTMTPDVGLRILNLETDRWLGTFFNVTADHL